MKYYSYDEFKNDYKELSKKMEDEKFDTIIAVARGGMMLGQYLSYALNVRDLQSLRVISYNHQEKLQNIELFENVKIRDGAHVLIVDDIIDSGDTLRSILDDLQNRYKNTTFKSASIFYKQSASVQPDFAIKEALEWIEFFWEVD